MYIKNIDSSLLGDMPIKYRFNIGNIIFGKILFNDDSAGAIKLFDGTIIPAIFLSENNKEDNSFVKFKVEGFNNEFITLSMVKDEKNINEDSINSISSKLSIPIDKGKEIIHSLIKFNLPATDENILNIYKNLEFINKAKDLNPNELLDLLKGKISVNINFESREFKLAQDILKAISNIDVDFLSFLIENQIPSTVDKITNLKDILKSNFFLDNLIAPAISNKLSHESLENAQAATGGTIENNNYAQDLDRIGIGSENTKTPKSQGDFNKLSFNEFADEKYIPQKLSKSNINSTTLLLEKLLKKLPAFKEEILKNSTDKFNIRELKIDSPEEFLSRVISKHMVEKTFTLKNFLNKLEFINHLLDNYNIYNFNTKIYENYFKNSIIIKSKYKGAKYLDPNNIKAFINVDTPSLGLIEGYIHKKNSELVILLKIREEHMSILKKYIDILQDNLLNNGYSYVNISLEKLRNPNNIISLSDFFNDYGFQGLDVKA